MIILPLNETESFFIHTGTPIGSKRTKTYPRVMGHFNMRKENTKLYSLYRSLNEREDWDNEINPLTKVERKMFQELRNKYYIFSKSNIFWFTFDVKRESHCKFNFIGYNIENKSGGIQKLLWQNQIFINLMKDYQSLKSLNDIKIERLFKQQEFNEVLMSEYILAALKI